MLATPICDDEVSRGFDVVMNIYDSREQMLRRLDSAIEQSQTNPYSDSHELSERERDVLVLVAKGLANKEIADKLNISTPTVIFHRRNISEKIGSKTIGRQTIYAVMNGIVDFREL